MKTTKQGIWKVAAGSWGSAGLFALAGALVVGPSAGVQAQTAQLQLLQPGAIPPAGSFYSLQFPKLPPMPVNLYPQLEVYSLSDEPGRYWVDDRSVDYAAMQQQSQMESALRGLESQYGLASPDGPPPVPGDGGTNGYNGSGGSGFEGQVITTNSLWLQVVGTTNAGSADGTAYLVINAPWNAPEGVYDLFATTNLAPGAWQWVMRTAAGETNLTVTGLAGPNAFFILGTMLLANDGSGLTVAYENLVGSAFSSDGYGTPNAWYLENGLNPLAPGIGTQDPNQDGLPNWQEYLWGGNPQVGEGFSVWVSSPSGGWGIP